MPGLDVTRRDLWLQQPSPKDTSLDLGARAATEVQSPAAPGEYFDANVVRAILGLGDAARNLGVHHELVVENRGGTGFVLEAAAGPKIKERLRFIAAPRAYVVSGRLDEIGHGLGRFRLLMGSASLQG